MAAAQIILTRIVTRTVFVWDVLTLASELLSDYI